MTIEVLMYHSAMTGAPSATLTTAGALTTLLDACLVNGFNTRTVTSLTRSGSVATANIDGSNPFQIGEVVEIAGASPAAYSTRHRVTARTAGSVSFAIDGTPTTPATGTITIKHPGSGWQRLAIDTNVVGYRTIAGGVEHWVQVEDNNPFNDSNVSAAVRMAVGLTGLNTATQLAERCRINKRSGWVLVADGRTAYLVMEQFQTLVFGEAASFADADDYCFIQSRGQNALSGAVVEGTGLSSGAAFPVVGPLQGYPENSLGVRLLRSYTQLGGDVNGFPGFVRVSTDQWGGISAANSRAGNALASPVCGKVLLFPIFLLEKLEATGTYAPLEYRGTLRGVYSVGGPAENANFVNGFVALNDVVIGGVTKRVIIVRAGMVDATRSVQFAIDVSDTWG